MKKAIYILAIIFIILCGATALFMFIFKEPGIGLLFIILSSVGIIPLALFKPTKENKFTPTLKNKCKFSTYCFHMDGLPNVIIDTPCIIGVNPESGEPLCINTTSGIIQNFSINLCQIMNIGIKTESEIIEQNKNVIGRGIVGGLLFGGLGAIIGGISGTGTKKKRINHKYLIINYKNSSEELCVMSFKVFDSKGLNNLIGYIGGYVNQNSNNSNISL